MVVDANFSFKAHTHTHTLDCLAHMTVEVTVVYCSAWFYAEEEQDSRGQVEIGCHTWSLRRSGFILTSYIYVGENKCE